jgi:cellulose synthase/poly-beta-1,6-N-acetylglucosamine synthase-like glycosyltransferase
LSGIGVVIVGYNEAEHLERCIASARRGGAPVVFADAGSTDDSVTRARASGVEVVALSGSRPATAAGARNAGARRLLEIAPATELVQFVDGDCELVAGWVERAAAELRGDSGLAIVCGRRRERRREASIYNRLCDMEWDTPIGPARYCGGDIMIRAGAFTAVGGYNPLLAAGEEPELCVRLRAGGWRVLRIDAEMTVHDASMTSFAQWWRRSVRAGLAYAEGSAMHGGPPERHWVAETRSNWFWGSLPFAATLLTIVAGAVGLTLLAAYAALAVRIYRRTRARGYSPADSRLYAAFCVLGKFPQLLGQVRYRIGRIRRG